MNVFVIVLIFIIGVICVVKGGDLFVDAASWIARAFGIPTFIIGATIVSIATTLPEMIVSAMASFEGKNDIVYSLLHMHMNRVGIFPYRIEKRNIFILSCILQRR